MAKVLYTARAECTGGRIEGHGKTSDGSLEVDFRIPADLGGPGGGTNPEQLFALGYAACFDNALNTAARRLKVEVDQSSVESEVMMRANDDRGFELAVNLHVKLPGLDDEAAIDLVRVAHKVCPYSNATRGNVEVELTANGRPVT